MPERSLTARQQYTRLRQIQVSNSDQQGAVRRDRDRVLIFRRLHSLFHGLNGAPRAPGSITSIFGEMPPIIGERPQSPANLRVDGAAPASRALANYQRQPYT